MRLRSLLLIAAVCLSAIMCSAQGRTGLTVVQGSTTVTFSATPVFDASKANVFFLTLTGAVSSSTLSNTMTGQPLTFEICQDGTGGRTFVPPTNVKGWLTIASAASACTTQSFVYDGSNAQPLTATSAVLNGVVFPASPSTHSVPVITASNTATWKVVPDCTDVTGNHLNYTQSTDAWSCGTSVPANVATTSTFASPPALGNTTPAAVNATTLSATGAVTKVNNVTTADFGVMAIVGTPRHFTGQTANIAATDLLTSPVSGTYHVYAHCRTTTSGTGTTAVINVTYADEGGAKTATSGSWALNSVTITGTTSLNYPAHISSGTAVQFSTSGTYGTSVYACDAWLAREN
jgi:hypothetical protein